MYGKKEKQELPKGSTCQQNDVNFLFSTLESTDVQAREEMKTLIRENLSATKESWLLHSTIDYYMSVHSRHALEILAGVREPHDKHLLDRISDDIKMPQTMSNAESTRYQALLLFSRLVYMQPPWLLRIANHRVFSTILSLLKTDEEVANLTCALYTVVSLLPMIPSQLGPFLNDMFEIFSRLAAWSTRKPIKVPEIHVLHLQVGVYSLFHRLYGMFPCNFLAYLRSHYRSGIENSKVFTSAIKPMLERVRLHPLLVTEYKESEKDPKRWKKMAPHDVLVECAKISLDAIEGTSDDTKYHSSTFNTALSSSNNVLENMQFISVSSHSSAVSVTVDSSYMNSDAINASTELAKNSLQTSEIITSSASSIIHSFKLTESSKDSSVKYSSTTQLATFGDANVPLDIAIEAKPEDIEIAPNTSSVRAAAITTEDCSLEASDSVSSSRKASVTDVSQDALALKEALSSENRSGTVMTATEAKEEDVLDREVSELTSVSSVKREMPQEEIRQDTPFCSTTQNLTDEPTVLRESDNILSKSQNEAYEEADVVQEHSEIKMDEVVQTLNRMRYLSHCVADPELPEFTKTSVKKRSSSCPNILFDYPLGVLRKNVNENHEVPSSSIAATHVPDIISVQNSLPSVHMPVPGLIAEQQMRTDIELRNSKYRMEVPFFSTLSPAELLDRHLQYGSEAFVNQLASIPITATRNTDWTHFGGKPPDDEVAMLQKNILLLHNQMMFERHRREIHGERNRNLLGLAKKAKRQKEYSLALKDQVVILERENESLKKQYNQQTQMYQKLEQEKNAIIQEFRKNINKLQQDNESLSFNKKKLQGLLVLQKEEQEKIIKECNVSQSQIVDLKFELERQSYDLIRYRKLEKEFIWLTKQHVLLQELNQNYRQKLEALKDPIIPEIEVDIVKDAARAEIKNLRQVLESKSNQLDMAKAKIEELEVHLTNMKSKLSDQAKTIESLKSIHKDEVMAKDERILELRKMHYEKDAHILELYHEQERLSKEIEILKTKVQDASLRDSSNDCSSLFGTKCVDTSNSEPCTCDTVSPTTVPDVSVEENNSETM